MKRAMVCGIGVLAATLAWAATGDGAWRKNVPAKDRVRANPMAVEPDSAKVGAKLFRQHCASCHGDDANGNGRKPGLRSEHVRSATEGELQWLLTNGSQRNGMPSWSGLPEPQRWQLVTYLKSLQ